MTGIGFLLGVLAMLSPILTSSRWIKFEEKVEEGGERWSKPHVSTLSLHSLFELRACLQTGTVLLDLDSGSLPQIIGEARASLLWSHKLGQFPQPYVDLQVHMTGQFNTAKMSFD